MAFLVHIDIEKRTIRLSVPCDLHANLKSEFGYRTMFRKLTYLLSSLSNRFEVKCKGGKMVGSKVLVLGSSHIGCIAQAYDARGADSFRNHYSFKSLMDFDTRSRIISPEDGDFSEASLKPHVQEWFRTIGVYDKLILSISGSDYLATCISLPDPLIDFIVPTQPDLPLNSDARIVPYFYLREKLRRDIRHVVLGIQAIRKAYTERLFYLEPPPPIESNEYITAHSDWAAGLLSRLGPSDPVFRYKYWLMHNDIVKSECLAAGVHYIPLPQTVLNERGFMAESALIGDVMHAGVWFGDHTIQMLETAI